MTQDELRIKSWTDDKDIQVQWYAEFLDDGDFELWQPHCYEYLPDTTAMIEAQRQYCRGLWFKLRFPEYGTQEHGTMSSQMATAYNDLIELKKLYEEIK